MGYGFYPDRIVVTEPQQRVFQSGSLLFYVSGGGGVLHVNDMDLPVGKGSFGWLHSYHIYSFEPKWGGKMELYQCPFEYAPASYITYQGSLAITRKAMTECTPVVGLEGGEAAHVESLMREFIEEGAGEGLFNLARGYSLFLELSTLFLRCSAREAKRQGQFERSLAWKLLQHIFTYSNENLTRGKLAALYGVSEREVGSSLYLAAGQSFPRLLNRARVDRACDMLHYGGLTIRYIGGYVGYHSETAFHRAFREYKGMTPLEYQKAVMPLGGKELTDPSALAVLHYLFVHFREPVTVTQVAKNLYMEKNSVNQVLRENFGMGLSAILTELRMTYGASLLCGSQMPVADVACACGYGSPHTFHRVFSKKYKMTPGEYRNLQGGGTLWNAD